MTDKELEIVANHYGYKATLDLMKKVFKAGMDTVLADPKTTDIESKLINHLMPEFIANIFEE